MSDIKLSVPETAETGEIVELKAMIRHNMESGYRLDIQGQRIPRNILSRFECRLDNTLIFSAGFYPGVSANPLIKFHHRAIKSGTLTFEWIEQTGKSFVKTAELIVT